LSCDTKEIKTLKKKGGKGGRRRRKRKGIVRVSSEHKFLSPSFLNINLLAPEFYI
jgi:hypothetical protein